MGCTSELTVVSSSRFMYIMGLHTQEDYYENTQHAEIRIERELSSGGYSIGRPAAVKTQFIGVILLVFLWRSLQPTTTVNCVAACPRTHPTRLYRGPRLCAS